MENETAVIGLIQHEHHGEMRMKIILGFSFKAISSADAVVALTSDGCEPMF